MKIAFFFALSVSLCSIHLSPTPSFLIISLLNTSFLLLSLLLPFSFPLQHSPAHRNNKIWDKMTWLIVLNGQLTFAIAVSCPCQNTEKISVCGLERVVYLQILSDEIFQKIFPQIMQAVVTPSPHTSYMCITLWSFTPCSTEKYFPHNLQNLIISHLRADLEILQTTSSTYLQGAQSEPSVFKTIRTPTAPRKFVLVLNQENLPSFTQHSSKPLNFCIVIIQYWTC